MVPSSGKPDTRTAGKTPAKSGTDKPDASSTTKEQASKERKDAATAAAEKEATEIRNAKAVWEKDRTEKKVTKNPTSMYDKAMARKLAKEKKENDAKLAAAALSKVSLQVRKAARTNLRFHLL